MEVNQKTVKRKLAQANRIYNYLSTNKVTRQDEIFRNLKIDSRLVSWLAQNKIIYMQNGHYVWNPKLKPNAKMIETYQIYYLDLVKGYRNPKSSSTGVKKSVAIKTISILWGLIKFEYKVK